MELIYEVGLELVFPSCKHIQRSPKVAQIYFKDNSGKRRTRPLRGRLLPNKNAGLSKLTVSFFRILEVSVLTLGTWDYYIWYSSTSLHCSCLEGISRIGQPNPPALSHVLAVFITRSPAQRPSSGTGPYLLLRLEAQGLPL